MPVLPETTVAPLVFVSEKIGHVERGSRVVVPGSERPDAHGAARITPDLVHVTVGICAPPPHHHHHRTGCLCQTRRGLVLT